MEITTTILWYVMTMAAGGAFVIAYQHIKLLSLFDDCLDDEEDVKVDDSTTCVQIGDKYYDIPSEVATSISIMNECTELLAADLAKAKKKDVDCIFVEYYKKAKKSIEK